MNGGHPGTEDTRLDGIVELESRFAQPPAGYGVAYIWHWNGDMEEAVIERQLRAMQANGVGTVMIWAYYGLKIDYLSPAWFARVAFALSIASALGMQVWIWDEGSYPSGCAEGRVTRDRPDLQGKALAPVERVPLGGNVQIVQRLPEHTVSVCAARRAPGSDAKTLIADELVHLTDAAVDGRLAWDVPEGNWELLIFTWRVWTHAFRSVRAGYKKDREILLPDYLKREATETFIQTTYEAYREAVGEHFGATLAGFFNDEPGVPRQVWTDALLDVFTARQGYDLRAHLPALFFDAVPLDVEGVRHDYADVWSAMLREHYTRPLAEWCESHGLAFTAHVCGEEDPAGLCTTAGDYFRFMAPIQMPGIDAIWRQLWPGRQAHFPKLASSAAHVRGRPRCMTETNAVYGRGLSVEQAKWVADHQLARGINFFFVMEYLYSDETFRRHWHPVDFSERNVQWDAIGDYNRYVSRLSFLLSAGRPAARIAVVYPTKSIWAGDARAPAGLEAVADHLLGRQRDFDYVDDDALADVLTVKNGSLSTEEGLAYACAIVPPGRVLSARTAGKLLEFAQAGGTVLVVGTAPRRGGGSGAPDSDLLLSRLLGQASVHLVPDPVADSEFPDELLPVPEIRLTPPTRAVKYCHRRLADADVYFLHNEGEKPWDGCAWFHARGRLQEWDPLTASVRAVYGAEPDRDSLTASLRLDGWQTRTIVIRQDGDGDLPAPQEQPTGSSEPIPSPLRLDGEWILCRLDSQATVSTPLRSWMDLGWTDYSGRVSYRTEFQLPPAFLKHSLWINLGQVLYSAEVRVNGQPVGRCAWRPYRLNITHAVHAGRNELEVVVTNTNANEVMGNPERLTALKASGLLEGSYFGYYESFDREQLPSGLMGPVRIVAAGL